MEYKDYYKIMGVSKDAAQDEIKRSYRKLARKYHPDVSKEPDAEARFKEVNEAYEVLKDPEKRAAYDQLGSQWKQGQEFHPPPGWDAGFEFSGGGFTGADHGHFSDFFESLFGMGSPFGLMKLEWVAPSERALAFIFSENSSMLPALSRARERATSLGLLTSRARRRSIR